MEHLCYICREGCDCPGSSLGDCDGCSLCDEEFNYPGEDNEDDDDDE